MRKIFALAVSIILVVSIFAGCSSDELGFYETAKSMNAMKDYNFSGNISFAINKLEANPSSPDGAADPMGELSLIKSMLNNATVTYDGSLDSSKSKLVFNVELKTGDDSFDTSFNMILDDGNNGSILDLSPEIASMIMPVDLTYTEVTVNGIDYYQYDINQTIDQINSMQPSQPEMTNPYDETTQKAQYDAYTTGFNDGYSDGYNENDDNSENYSGDAQAYEDGYDQGMTNILMNENEDSIKSMVPELQSLTTIFKTTSDQTDLQNKLSSLEDELMNHYFSNLTLSLITKTGDSTYSCNATVTDLYNAFDKVFQYIEKNPEQLKSILSNFVNSLSDSQFNQLIPGGVISKSELIDEINNIDFSQLEDTINSLGDEVKSLTDNVSSNIDFTLQKVGSEAYNISDTLSFNNNSQEDADYFIDFSIKENTLIDGGSSKNDVGSTVSNVNVTSSNPTLSLKVTDPNVVGTGILLSTNKDMSSYKKLSATKIGANYVVNLSGLQSNVKYYYEVYTVDNAGNVLTSKQINDLPASVTTSNLVNNPDTKGNSNIPLVLVCLGLSAAVMSVLVICKRSTQN